MFFFQAFVQGESQGVGESVAGDSLEILSSGDLDYDFESGEVASSDPIKALYGRYRIESGGVRWNRGRGLVYLEDGVRLDNFGEDFEDGVGLGPGDFFEAWWPESYEDSPFILTGESVSIDVGSQWINAEGGVLSRFRFGRIAADTLEIEQGEDPSLEASEVRAGSGLFIVGAESVSADEDEVVLENAGVFLSDPNDWGPRIYADRIEHGAGEKFVSLYGVTVGLGPVPILYLPRAWMRDWDLGISFDLGGGFSDNLGVYGEFGVSFKATSSLRLSPSVSYFSRRGWLLSPDFNWSRTSESENYYTEGSVLMGYISDRGDAQLRGVDRFGDPIGSSRGYLLARGIGNQRGGWSFVNQFEARSDTEVLRDFRPGLESRYFAPESFSELLVPLGPFSFTALGRFRTMDMTESMEAIPSLTLSLDPDRLGETGLVHDGWVDFSRLERADFNDEDQASATRWEAAYRLSYEASKASWLSIRPVAGVRERLYEDVKSSGEEGSSTLFELGFDLGIDFHRKWPIQSEIWDIDYLIHQTRPILAYRWLPRAGMPESEIPEIRPEVYSSGVNPLGFSNLVYRSDDGAEQVLRLGWENRFLVASYDEADEMRDLGTFSIYQDFIDQRAGADSLPTNTMLAFSADPAPWLSLELFSRVETESVTLIEFVPGLSLRDGDRWRSTWYFQSLQREVNELLWDAEFAINRNNTFVFEMRYSGQTERITKQAYGWRHRLGNAWLLEASLIFRRGDSREGPFQVNFGFTSLLF